MTWPLGYEHPIGKYTLKQILPTFTSNIKINSLAVSCIQTFKNDVTANSMHKSDQCPP